MKNLKIAKAKYGWTCFLIASVVALSPMLSSAAQENPSATKTDSQNAVPPRDGQRDFDFEVGSWKIHLKRLLHPLAGSNDWVTFDGTSVTRKVWSGNANLEEFESDGPAGHIEGLTLRLYNPQAHQWSIYWATSKDGTLGLPATVGEFKNGRGEFYDQEVWHERSSFDTFGRISPQTQHILNSHFRMMAARPGK